MQLQKSKKIGIGAWVENNLEDESKMLENACRKLIYVQNL
jgi:hypothetical protein